jgi:hypothetical protein
VRSGASHEVSSPSAHTGRVALFADLLAVLALGERSGLPASEPSRFGVPRHRSRAILLRPAGERPPLRFYAAAELMRRRSIGRIRGVGRAICCSSSGATQIGKTLTPVIFDLSRECDRGNRFSTLARDPAVSSATTSIPSSKPGHAPTLPLARCSATRRSELRGLVGRVVPSRAALVFQPRPLSSDGAHGVQPFAGFIPPTGEPASLPARAHLSFALPVRPGLFSSG